MHLRFSGPNLDGRTRLQFTVHAARKAPPILVPSSAPSVSDRQEKILSSVNANGRGRRNKRRAIHKLSIRLGYPRDYRSRVASVPCRWGCLLSISSAHAAPAADSQCAATGNRAVLWTASRNSAGLPACLLDDECAGQREPDKALDGPQRLRPHGRHAAGNRRVAAG
jgi:hypothetical protein